MTSHLLLTYDFPPMGGGIARWMGEVAKRYPPGSLAVSTGDLPGQAETDRLFPNRIDRLGVPARRLRTMQGLLRWSQRVIALSQALQTEFIWCGNLKPASYPARWAATRLGTPYGIMVVGSDLLILRDQVRHSTLKRRAALALLRPASVIVSISRYTEELCRSVLEQLGITIGPDLLKTIHLGTDPLLFRPNVDTSMVRARYGIADRRWLLSVARLVPYKGIDTGIRVLAHLAPRYSDLGYLVVGSGEQLPELEALATRMGLSDRVRFLTHIPDHELPAVYNCAEAYLGLTRTTELDVEGFGISLVEASACGLPVIGARTGGIPDAVREGETGLLVDPTAPEQVAETVSRVLDDRTLSQRLATAGRSAVERYYNWDRVTSELIAVGNSVAAQAAVSSGRTLIA